MSPVKRFDARKAGYSAFRTNVDEEERGGDYF